MVLKYRKDLFKKLKWTCAEWLQKLEEEEKFEWVTPFNTVAAIRNTIAHLSEEENMWTCGNKFVRNLKTFLNR